MAVLAVEHLRLAHLRPDPGEKLQLLARGGVTGAEAREALRVLVVYTIGSAAYAVPNRGRFELAAGIASSARPLIS